MTMRRFVLRTVTQDGKAAIRNIEAPSRADALRRAAQFGVTVVDLTDAQEDTHAQRRSVSKNHAILVLRQLSVMTRAGVNLLEALETIAGSLPGHVLADKLRNIALALRRGERLASAMQTELSLYPTYVYALIRAGESSGKLAQVLEEAALQITFERRVSRDIQNALVYPGFLIASGVASVAFLLYAVVPRFADMLANTNAEPRGLSRLILEAGVAFHANAPFILAIMAACAAALWALSSTPEVRRLLSAVAHATPGLRDLLIARQRTAWSRVAALSLSAGVGILEATALAAGALSDGRLKLAVARAIPALRAGRPIDAAFAETGALSTIDASLLRAGQRSGALPQMFRAVADRNEEDLRDALKRLTVIVEPLAIAAVALMVGAIVLGLASSLVGVYESIG